MRHDHRHAPAHLVIDHAPAREHGHEHRTAQVRILQHDVRRIDTALRPQPFLIEASPAVFVEADEIRDTHDAPEARQDRQRIEPGIGIRIKPDIMGIGAAVIMRHPGLADRILRKQSAGPAADEFVDADDDIIPQRRLQPGVVDGLDEA